MKKRLVKFLTVILSVIIGAASLVGCNIVTDNLDRDLNQVVATVNVNQKENIYKKDLVMAYMNGGYMYVQYYGYDAATVYNMMINSLVENRIMVQVAYEEFEKSADKDDTKAKYTPERYLDADEITDAKYDTYKSINDLLDAYSEDKSDFEKQGTLVFDVRTVPTDAQNAEDKLTKKEKDDYIAKGFDITSTEYKRAAFNKVITLLKDNGLLGSDYNGSIETTDYFNRLLKSNFESAIIEKYEDAIKQKIINDLTYDKLAASYDDKLDAQKAWSNSDFVSALSSATATSPILYSKDGTYGYVYNLLLGVNDYQSDKISELQHEKAHEHLTEAEYAAGRKEILAGTVAKDLRASWILSGYDFDFDSKKFTGDYTFAKTEGEAKVAANSLAFQGEVKEIRAKTDDKDGIYSIGSVKTFGLEEFTKFVNKYVYNDESDIGELADPNRYYEYDLADKPVEYDAKINELLFAFSTDSGSLNTYKGYVIKPDNSEYVKTFGDAGKELLQYAAEHQGKSGSYKVVASDYGYHFMFFSEVWTANKEYATLDDYLDTLNIDRGAAATWQEYFNTQKGKWEDFEEENNFLYFLANEWISVRLSDATTRSRTNIVTEYRYGEHKDSTVIYKDRFSDLLG